MLARIGAAADRLVRRFMPDPFVLVLALLGVTFVAATATVRFHGVPVRDATAHATDWLGAMWWVRGFLFSGFAELLTFAMQMVLIVVTGEAIASSPPVARAIRRAARLPRTSGGALAFVATAALVLGWFHWGFGLMASAALAREVAADCKSRGIAVHYPLLGTAAYMSMLLWHAGTSASAPLLINTPHHFLASQIGIVPLSQTVFLPRNLAVCAILLVSVPFLVRALEPRTDRIEIDDGFVRAFRSESDGSSGIAPTDAAQAIHPIRGEAPAPDARPSFAERMDRFRGWQLLASGLGIWFLVQYFRVRSLFALDQNVLNFAFLMFGLPLYRTPGAYARAITRSMRGTSGIVLQFPFYGAIMVMLRDSGLSHVIAHAFVHVATAQTLPFFTYCASLVTKLFVPSGGGEWAVEGPVMLSAAQRLHAPIGLTTMGVAYGNMAGNMFQPFWALPLLGIVGLRAKDIMGYSLVVFVFAAPILGIALWLH